MSASKRQKLSSMAPPKQSPIVRFYDPDVEGKDTLGRTQQQILAWSNSQLENSHNYIQMLFPLPEGSPYNFAAPVIDFETMQTFRSNNELRQRLRASFERMLTFYGFTTSTHPELGSGDEKNAGKQEQRTTEDATKTAQATSKSAASALDAQAPPTATRETPEATIAAASADETEADAVKSTTQAPPFGYYVVRGPNFRRASSNWAVRMDHNHLRITRILRCLRVLGLQRECDAFFLALKLVYEDPTINIGHRSLKFWTRAVERPLYIAPDDEECDWLKALEEKEQRDAT